MTTFHQIALAAIAVWLVLVVRFPKSKPLLLAGLLLLTGSALFSLGRGDVTAAQLGLAAPESWLVTLAWAGGWLILLLAYSPLADLLATRMVATPPDLEAFRGLQRSVAMLLAGIVIAWILGGFLEELIFRGIVLAAIQQLASHWLSEVAAATIAIGIAACGAGVVHLYQGLRAALIITQLSALFGVLFVLTGHNLWAVILCHGLYDTVAFIRFAMKKSRYAQPTNEVAG